MAGNISSDRYDELIHREIRAALDNAEKYGIAYAFVFLVCGLAGYSQDPDRAEVKTRVLELTQGIPTERPGE